MHGIIIIIIIIILIVVLIIISISISITFHSYFSFQQLNDGEVSNLISSPSYFICEEEEEEDDDAFPRPNLLLYSLSSVLQTPVFQKRMPKDSASQKIDLPSPSVNDYMGSWAFQPNRLDQSDALSQANVVHCSSCPKHCPRICQETQGVFPRFTAFREERQRPGVIMVPVSRNEINESAVTHVPLQVRYGKRMILTKNKRLQVAYTRACKSTVSGVWLI